MSGEQFLRAHGWKMGGGLFFHDRLPGQGHAMEVAILQQGQWLAEQVKEACTLLDDWHVTMHHVPAEHLAAAIQDFNRKSGAWLRTVKVKP